MPPQEYRDIYIVNCVCVKYTWSINVKWFAKISCVKWFTKKSCVKWFAKKICVKWFAK